MLMIQHTLRSLTIEIKKTNFYLTTQKGHYLSYMP